MKFPDLELNSFFTWSNRPRILYGPGVRSELGFEMKQLGGKRAYLITDPGVVQAGVAGMVVEEIAKSGLGPAGVFDRILQDARIDIINEAAAGYREAGADWGPDVVLLTHGFCLKPHVARALAGFPLVGRYYAHELMCARDGFRYRDGAPCPNDFLRTPGVCRDCAAESLRDRKSVV